MRGPIFQALDHGHSLWHYISDSVVKAKESAPMSVPLSQRCSQSLDLAEWKEEEDRKGNGLW